MRKGDATPILRGAKTMLFLLAAIVTSTLFVTYDSRPTAAEGLLYRVVCSVGNLLNQECRNVPDSGPTTPAPSQLARPDPQPTPPPAQPETPAPQSSRPVANTIQPLEVNADLMAELPNIPLIPSLAGNTSSSPADFPAHTLQLLGESNGEVLGSSVPAIQATEEGWKLWGVQWYWWLLTIGAIVSTALLARSNRLRTLKHLVK